jgi:serine/threonine protein kinase
MLEVNTVMGMFESCDGKPWSFTEACVATRAKVDAIDATVDIVPEQVTNLFDDVIEALKKVTFKAAFDDLLTKEEQVIRYRDLRWFTETPVKMDDFVVFRELGRGAFGVVSGARHRQTGQMVALKAMNRKLVKGKKVLKMVVQEFKILKALGENPNPYCVALLYSFQDATDFYLGLPLCTGGDLMFHLRSNQKGFGVDRTRFFAAELVIAIEHLHKLGILYRDLTPEHVLLDDQGHTKIRDMGLAVITGYTPKTIGNKTFSGRAGTPGYWPPEMIKKEGYAFDADWWSYGVMLYEFLTGHCAFSESHTKCKDRNEGTLTWEITVPEQTGDDDLPEAAKSLVLCLLERNRELRVGAKPDAVEQIKAHEYFKGVDWNKVAEGETPPWKPAANAINAVSQEELADMSNEHEYKKLKLTEEDTIQGIEFSSRYHEMDVAKVLFLEKKGKLTHLDASESSSFCTLL